MLRISRGSVKLKLKLIYIYKYTHACFYTFSYSEWSCMLINPIDNYPSKFLQAFRGMWEIVLVSRVAILKAMLDLDALTWRLWKLGMPRVHCLDGSYEERSYSICFQTISAPYFLVKSFGDFPRHLLCASSCFAGPIQRMRTSIHPWFYRNPWYVILISD